MRVHFKDVGRNKQSWTSTVAEAGYTTLLAAVKQKGALMSSDVDFVMNKGSDTTGVILVGGFRGVGTFTISSE